MVFMVSKQTLAFVLACLISSYAGANAKDWQNITKEKEAGLPGDEVQFIHQDDDGSVWVGTLSGVTQYADQQWKPFRDEKGNVSKLQAWAFFRESPEVYWIGHHGGVLRRQGDSEHGMLAGYSVASIVRYGDALWALGRQASDKTEMQSYVLMGWDGKDWSPIEQVKDKRVVDMCAGPDGRIYFVIEGDGLWVVDPAEGFDKVEKHLDGLAVSTVFFDSKPRVWCGLTAGGVAVYEAGEWTRYLGKTRSAFLSFAEDNAGNIWVATNDGGVWCYDGQAWVHHLKDEGPVNLLEATSDGKVWVCSNMRGGLQYWDGVKWLVSLKSPLPVRCLLESKDGTLWAGGIMDGVHILKP